MALPEVTTIHRVGSGPAHCIGSGPAIVLLHGIGAEYRTWDSIAALTGRFETLSYDFPGHGEAPPPDGSYEIGDLAEQLLTVLNTSGIERAHIVGSSLGGMVALDFAASWPERVERLVLCDTTPALSEGMRDEFLATGNQARAAMARADLMDMAEEIFVPTLVLCAEGADLAMREGADFLARSIPRGQFAFVPRAKKDVIAERPGWVTRALTDFLR
jgi:pimeloyl-ACP methyl ester carboxylesterase